MRKTIVFGFIVAALTASGLAWWLWPSGDDTIRILETATVERGVVRKELEATGIIQTQVGAIISIGAQATGRIERMLVKVGDAVTRGELIAVIDDRELIQERDESVARMEKDMAELARVSEVSPLSIREAEAQLDVARAEADYAATNLRRQRALAESGLIAQDTLDDAAQTARVKAGNVVAKEAALERIRAEFAKELDKARKTVAQDKAALASIDTRISYTRIKSPIDGVVSSVAAQEGETVVTGLQVADLITVLDPSRLEMWIYVDETDVGQILAGQSVEFTVDAYPGKTFSGVVDQIYPEPETRDNIVYYQALVTLTREQAMLLRPEMTTQCRIVVQARQDVLALPNAALKWVDGRQVVFVAGQGEPRRVEPELGLEGLTHSEVVSGLEEGQSVATQLVLPGGGAKKKSSGSRP